MDQNKAKPYRTLKKLKLKIVINLREMSKMRASTDSKELKLLIFLCLLFLLAFINL